MYNVFWTNKHETNYIYFAQKTTVHSLQTPADKNDPRLQVGGIKVLFINMVNFLIKIYFKE